MKSHSPSTSVVALGAIAAFLACMFPQSAMAKNDPAGVSGLIVPVIEFPTPDYAFLEQDDIRRDLDGLPMRFAVPNATLITPVNSGIWDRTIEGRLRWQLRVGSKGVPHINLGFEEWNMPTSGVLTLDSMDGTNSLGPYTALDNQNHGELWLPVITGDDILISITCDDEDREAVENGIALTSVNIGYRGFGAAKLYGADRSGSCNIDVVCPEGDPWQAEIACVGLYAYSGFLACTGSMLNNTAQDETPFFLTADHCGLNTGNDQSMVVYWNYQNSYCRVPNSGDSGGNGNGNLNQATTGGAVFRAGSSNSDFTLVELNNSPNPNYNVGYCGWDRRTVTPQEGIGIHHPNLEEKRISFENDPLSSQGSYWRVNDWDGGTTEPGSSGSPIFSPDHRVVGQLFGGLAACNNNEYDVYGKLSSSWNSGLGNWLDSAGTGEQFIETLGSGAGNGGVCCLQGGCYNVPESTCTNAGGTWQPDETCASVDCSDPEPVGACCLADGSCSGNQTSDQCAAADGTWQGEGTSCGSVNCPQPEPTGACCISSLTCNDNYTSAECSAAGGDYQGDNTDCAFVNCDTSGGSVEFFHAIVGTNLLSVDQDNWTVDIYASVGPGNRVDAVAGNSIQEKLLTSTYGFYQDPNGGPTSVSINPNFYSFVPDLEWDSRVTIGALDQTGNPFDANNLGDVGINWTTFENGGTLAADNGTWYVLPTDSQGDAVPFIEQDCSSKYGVLIARLTAFELDAEISIDALIQGRDSLGNTFQEAVSHSFTYEAVEDCNDNGISDTCDIANGTSQDSDGNGIPDECDSGCPGDVDGDGDVDVNDVLAALANYGGSGEGDVDNDGDVDVNDLLQILADYGGC
ncbi:MAG: hypothetical protein CMJ29_02675 [Phycisphaerae bacterium]|nr:hypothetical protein [Phycisphaerae bacterium]